MQYGSIEFAYAEPFAKSLVADSAFREWVLRRTKFSDEASGAKLLSEEMKALRGRSSATWWRSHYSEKCRCEGCSGQETDILAVFEAEGGHRFAVHFEVKQPTDRFPTHKDQGRGYAVRAQCWVKSAPKAIVPHGDADTVLLCSASKRAEYAQHVASFGSVITFEEVADRFPGATAVRSA